MMHEVNIYLLRHSSVIRGCLGKSAQTYTAKCGVRSSQQGDGCWEETKDLLVKGLYLLLMCFKGLYGLAACGETAADQESFSDK